METIRVLIVDDEAMLCDLIQEGLEQQWDRYDLATAYSGREALALLAQRSFDVLVTDIRMPDIDGIDLMRQALEIQDDLETIFITGHGDLDNAIEAMRLGAGNYFRKPISIDDLHFAILGAGEKRFLRQRLRVSEARFRCSFFNAASGIATVDNAYRFLQVNQSFCRMFGYSEEELLTLTMHHLTHPDDLSESYRQVERLMKKSVDHFHMEKRYLRKDGETLWARTSVSLILDCEEHQNCFVVQVSDMTRQKVAEMSLRRERDLLNRVMETSPTGITVLDRQGQITYANSYAQKIWQISGEETANRTFDDSRWRITDAEGNPFPEEQLPFHQIMKTGQPVFGVEHALEQANGERMILSINASPLFDTDGRISGMVSAIEDITMRKKMDQEMLKLQKLDSIARLAGGIAHDFNNILMIIMGNLSMAQDYAEPDSELMRILSESEQACVRANELTRRFLTFSRSGAPVRQAVNLVPLVKDAAELARAGARIRYAFETGRDTCIAHIDARQINQAIVNVVTNAVEAMPENGLLTIRMEEIPAGKTVSPELNAEKAYIRLSFQDEGVGIQKKNLPNIFDPYYSTKERGAQRGMGLGLSTTYAIIKQHGGFIDVRSRLRKGTTVDLYLPCDAPEPVEELPEPERTGRHRVLIMDDDASIRRLIGKMLKFLGYDVEAAKDGNEAVAKYRQAVEAGVPFAAAILDLTIPGGMGGREAIRQIRLIDPDVKAILSSGYADDPVLIDHRQYGFSDVIIKPYKLRNLEAVLNRIFASPESPGSGTAR